MPYKDPEKQKAAQRRHTERNREKRRLSQQAKRREMREWITSLKRDISCKDCAGVFHPAAMHFDHLPGYVKVAGIREMVNRFPNRALIEAEMAKCELVCANCHAVRTYERGQYWS